VCPDGGSGVSAVGRSPPDDDDESELDDDDDEDERGVDDPDVEGDDGGVSSRRMSDAVCCRDLPFTKRCTNLRTPARITGVG
jgi:hypothetical protein